MIARLLTVLALLLWPLAAQAQTHAELPQSAKDDLDIAAQNIVDVLEGRRGAAEVFSPAFLAAVPESQLKDITEKLNAQFGAIVGVEEVTPLSPSSAKLVIRFEHALGSGPFQLDSSGLVAGLLLNEFSPIDDSPQKISADLAALPGNVSVFLAPLDETQAPMFAMREDEQFAIGSAFKLYVLSALAHSIEAGEHSWNETIPLSTHSLPSGTMQDWPLNTPVTLHTLASMMISISDNTATDELIKILGRETVEREIYASGHSDPHRMLPMLTTLELFGLKGDAALAEQYLAQDEAGQRLWIENYSRRIAGDPARINPPRFAQPHAINTLEWYASGQDLRGIMTRLAALKDPTALQIMTINPAIIESNRQNWQYIGYKGGSEPGVLNLTWILQNKQGQWFVLAMSWNNPDAVVSTETFELLSTRVMKLIPN